MACCQPRPPEPRSKRGQLLVEGTNTTGWALSRLVCERRGWRKSDGGLKDVSWRVALPRMQEHGLLLLPPPWRKNGNGKRHVRRTPLAEPQALLCPPPVGERRQLWIEIVADKHDSVLWNE